MALPMIPRPMKPTFEPSATPPLAMTMLFLVLLLRRTCFLFPPRAELERKANGEPEREEREALREEGEKREYEEREGET